MATDMEESDTEDHERPVPPKRQCTKLVDSHNEFIEQEGFHNEEVQIAGSAESDYEQQERQTREKLRRWQACQVAKGFVDNTINRVMENYILGPHVDVSSQLRLFRDTEMEDTAVMMAIQNHGLVHSGQFESHENDGGHSLVSSSSLESTELSQSKNLALSTIPAATTSSKVTAPTTTTTTRAVMENIRGRTDEGEDEQDFLERAVAEAIKIKGLSALSVDYG